MEKIVYNYISRDDIISDGIHNALDYVYSISFPKPEKSFMTMCKELNEECKRENGGNNWRKMYGKYQWPIDFFYIPQNVLEEVWKNHKEANKAINTWKSNLDWLSEMLFVKPGIKEVYSPTEWSDGKDVKHCEDQKLLKDIIGEEAAENVKKIIDDYRWTYRIDSSDELSFCGGFLSTPNTNKNTVINAWKEAFNIDINIPDDSAWVDIYNDDEDEYYKDEE